MARRGLSAGQAAYKSSEWTFVQRPGATALRAWSRFGTEARAYSAMGYPLSGMYGASADGCPVGLGLSYCLQETRRCKTWGRRDWNKTDHQQTGEVWGAEEKKEEGICMESDDLSLTISQPIAVALAKLAAMLTPKWQFNLLAWLKLANQLQVLTVLAMLTINICLVFREYQVNVL